MIGRRHRNRRVDGPAGPGGGVGTGSGVSGGELTADELATMRADDLLLDALGHGEPVARDDELAAMLGAWRAEMDTEPLPNIDVTAIVPAADLYAEPFGTDRDAGTVGGASTGVAGSAGVPDGVDSDGVRVRPAAIGRTTTRPAGVGPGGVGPADGRPAGGPGAGPGPDRTRSRRWPRGLRLGVAVALLIAAAGGVSITANAGGPDGPLWSVVRLVDPGRADLREAQDAVAKAQKAAAEQRYADARQLIDRAETLVARVRDPEQQAKLRDQLDALRRSLPAGLAPGVNPGQAPGAPGQTGAASPGQQGGTSGGPVGAGGATPVPTPTVPGLLPGLPLPSILPTGPLLPLPSSPAPLLPTCILPSGVLGLPPLCH